jgi:NNP family nitrate/nitrite transporter-like MFS transporter
VGLISGIVGAGGNLGGMLFGFLFKSESITYVQAFTYIGMAVIIVAAIVGITRWKPAKDISTAATMTSAETTDTAATAAVTL